LTARVLGFELGVARVVGAIVFGIIIGLLMALFFRKSEETRTRATMQMPDPPAAKRPLRQSALLLGAMIAFLVFSDWFNPGERVVQLKEDGTRFQAVLERELMGQYQIRLVEPYDEHQPGDIISMYKSDISLEPVKPDYWVVQIHKIRWYLAAAMGLLVVVMSLKWLDKDEFKEWMENTWTFSKLLVPLLFAGVFAVGFLGALIPEKQVAAWVGGNSLTANLVASVVGCLFYFATLTEVPILQTLVDNGMGSGPALALLLAGPALSIPSILVIRSVIGNTKTAVFVGLVVVMATIAGMAFGALFPDNPVMGRHPPTVAASDLSE